jgi:predicted ATP-grasp superfamily ATP-dependent carboligase
VPVSEAAIADCQPPVIVKARLHWTPGSDSGPRHLPVRLCTDQDQVRTRVAEITAEGGSAVLQEPVDGSLIAFTAVADQRSRIRASCQQRTTKLSVRGTSVRAETTPIDPALASGVAALLHELGWFGLANLQFLVSAGHQPRLIDLNARYYGSIALAIAAGADFPSVWADLAVGGTGTGSADGRPGHRFYALEEDLHRIMTDHSRLRARVVPNMIRSSHGAAHPIWSPSDPLPGILAVAGQFPRLGRGARHLMARRRRPDR